MITDTRKMFKSRWFRVAIILFVITMAGGGLLLQLIELSKGNRDWALRINGEEISKKQLARAISFQQDRINQIRRMYGQYADLILEKQGLEKDPSIPALEQIIFTTLLNQAACKAGIVVDPDYILEKISDPNYIAGNLANTVPMELFNPQGGIAAPALRNYLRRMNMSQAEFETMLESAFDRTTLLHMIIPASYIPEFMVRDAYLREYASKTFSYALLNYDAVLSRVKKNGLQEGELESFFELNKTTKYLVPEKRNGMLWQFDASSYDLTPSDEKMREYYEKHKSDFVKDNPKIQVRRILLKVEDDASKEEVEEQLNGIKKELSRDPNSFEALAKEHSQDELSSAEGGLLPYFARGERVSSDGVPFERAAFALERDGEISSIIETKNGFEILQRVDRLPRTFKDFSDVKHEIKTALAQAEINKNFVANARLMLSNGKIDETAWKNFIKRHSPKVRTITDKENDASRQAKELFSLKENEYAVYLNGQVGEVVMLSGIQSAYTPNLKEIKDTVETDLYESKAGESLRKEYNKANKMLKSSNLEDVAQEMGLKVVTVEGIKPDSEQEKEMRAMNVPIQKIYQLTVPGERIADLSGNNLILAELTSIEEIDDTLFAEKRDELAQRVGAQFISLFVSGYIASLRKNAKIETNDSIINIP